MPNSRFDKDHWRGIYRAQIAQTDWVITGPISSPIDIAKREEWLAANSQAFSSFQGQPADYLVHAFGEPPQPYQSKMGGIPYRPKNAQWPVGADGEPMQFFGQINLSNSGDLVPEANGAVLVMFHCGEDSCSTEEFRFEWYDEDIRDLPTEADIPAFESLHIEFPIHYEVFRTTEWPVPKDASKELRDYNSLVASKIGGVPAYFGDSDPKLPGRYFMTIDSLQISVGRPFPAINYPESLTRDDAGGYYAASFVMLGDLGSLFLNIDRDGAVFCAGQCH
jgi:hypothetical protein